MKPRPDLDKIMAQLPEAVLDEINLKMVLFSGLEGIKLNDGSEVLSEKKMRKLFRKTGAEHERLLKKAYKEFGGKDGR